MKEPRLSRQEQRILDGIEQGLRGDEYLDRELRTMRMRRRWLPRAEGPEAGRLYLATFALLVVCLVLFVAAGATGSRLLLWTFSGVWVATAPCLLVLIGRRCRRLIGTRPGGATEHAK
ncbi:DUF3040 domain-containing protein [Streptomyces yangpuensis]|uniref:DUF3040 domain-containing protein n=1 Tax=Streptomyces yangpuensis TaxID=1648182 RepID=UPI00381ED7B5